MFGSLAAFAALALAPAAAGLNILLTNDDSWASANICATYTALKADGHEVLLVGPAVQQSGKGGTFVLPTSNLTGPAEFNSVAAGAPYYGHDPADGKLWYFNGTPSASAVFGLDIVVPLVYGKDHTIDLVVSGPNEGQNNGPFLYTLSGTIGAAYASIGRGFPAIALSAGNGTHRSYTTNTGAATDPATLAGKVAANFVKALAQGVNTKKQRLLPLGVGLNLNLPLFGPASNCTAPAFVETRLTGGAYTDGIVINATTGLPVYTNVLGTGVNAALNGNTRLPGETPTSALCKTAVSVFAIDYDAPSNVASPVQSRLGKLWGKTSIH